MDKIKYTNFVNTTYCALPPLLPKEYQQVEYLQSYNENSAGGGESYMHINTGVYYFPNFEIKCQNAENTTNLTCGCGDSGYGATLGRYSNDWPRYTFFKTESDYFTTNKPITTKSKLAWINGNIIVDDVIVAQKEQPISSREFKLYGCVRGTYGAYYKSIRIFYCKMWDNNGTLIRHYIPCYKKSDGTPGMYDVVTGTFNAGEGSSGSFIVGSDI